MEDLYHLVYLPLLYKAIFGYFNDIEGIAHNGCHWAESVNDTIAL
jgi:hypothetical protein